MLDYAQVKDLLRGRRLPAAFVDLDAFDKNTERVCAEVRNRGTPVRVASKSVRVVRLLERLRDRGGALFQGLMCFSCEEAEALAGRGFDDLLVAYPAYQESDLDRMARLVQAGKRVSLVTDSRAGVDRASEVGVAHGVRIPLVVCVDMSLRLLAGRIHLGVRRSPLHSPEQVVRLARHVASSPGTAFHGLMGYEAQVAGLADANPFDPSMNVIKTAIRRASALELGRRRRAMVAALDAAGLHPAIVNGGGSGSLDTTTPATGVSEVTAGSAFYKPHLFDYFKSDHLRDLEPAAFFALEVTRRPTRGMVTCLGGGYVASGPASADKVPLPWLPRGLALTAMEMCGEVQTPLTHGDDVDLELGDPVVFRHAKAGELFERFSEVLLVSDGKVVDSVPTYRGEGWCFF